MNKWVSQNLAVLLSILAMVVSVTLSLASINHRAHSAEKKIDNHLVETERLKKEYVGVDVSKMHDKLMDQKLDEIVRRLERIERKVDR